MKNNEPYNPHTFMIIPSLDCQAKCKYCFMRPSKESMSLETLEHTVRFIENATTKGKTINVVFHGGEPLLGGISWFEAAFDMVSQRLQNAKISIQSNLWAIDQNFIDLFKKYNLKSIGTSLDGFPDFCDSQRCIGYFDKTTRGIKLLKENGFHVSAIATFCSGNTGFETAKKNLDFLCELVDTVSVHGVTDPIWGNLDTSLSVGEMEDLLKHLLHYATGQSNTKINTMRGIIESVYYKQPNICTFSNCLGNFAAIEPSGYIYVCQRFCGQREYAISNVFDLPTSESIMKNENYRLFELLEKKKKSSCLSCRQVEFCGGGCLYNTPALKNFKMPQDSDDHKDFYCEAYKNFFTDLAIKMATEAGSKLLGQDYPTPILDMIENKKDKQKSYGKLS